MSEEKKESRTWSEEFMVAGSELVNLVKKLIKEGNVRKIIIRKEDGEKIMELPLSFGVATAIFAAPLAAVGAMAAFIAKAKVEIIRDEDKKPNTDDTEDDSDITVE